ncbi:hypothetical protein [Variovorax atrisoli]|uniref:hypothetical protein n=1 Tax=Variovorax atrisoli TaxID=3394203 RepID=UPI00403FDE76
MYTVTGPDMPQGEMLDDFTLHFARICEEHLRTGRAKEFAFIFWNFKDGIAQHIVTDRDMNRELHIASGDQMTIFFLRSEYVPTIEHFNEVFMGRLGLDPDQELPCVVFFSMEKGRARQIEVVTFKEDWVDGYVQLRRAVDRRLRGERQALYLDEVEITDRPIEEFVKQLLDGFQTRDFL